MGEFAEGMGRALGEMLERNPEMLYVGLGIMIIFGVFVFRGR